jgi:hypothetical protein
VPHWFTPSRFLFLHRLFLCLQLISSHWGLSNSPYKHKSLPLDSIPNHFKETHISATYCLKMNFNIILLCSKNLPH